MHDLGPGPHWPTFGQCYCLCFQRCTLTFNSSSLSGYNVMQSYLYLTTLVTVVAVILDDTCFVDIKVYATATSAGAGSGGAWVDSSAWLAGAAAVVGLAV